MGAQAASPERRFSHLASIQEGDGRAPFFCVHGAGGDVLNFGVLARHLGGAQTFFGLRARGVGGEAPLDSVEEMADAYLAEIRAVRPEGPYLLGGYSGGGIVAYEMARRLRAAGAAVPLLVFVDTFHPSMVPRKLTMDDRRERFLREGPRYLLRQGKAKLSRHIGQLVAALTRPFHARHDMPLSLDSLEVRLSLAFSNAASRYLPRPYAGRVLLFRARLINDIYRHMGPALGWGEVIPDLEVVEVPGGHHNMLLEPNVQVLTTHLAQAIARATSTGAARD